MKSNESDNLRSNLECGMSARGEPDAVKAASPVRRGEWRNVLSSNGLCSYPTNAQINSLRPLRWMPSLDPCSFSKTIRICFC